MKKRAVKQKKCHPVANEKFECSPECPILKMEDDEFNKLMKELTSETHPQTGLMCKEYRYKGSKKK